MRKYEYQVSKGIDLLNKHKPTWRKKINIQNLCLQSYDNCILGQVYEDFDIGASILERKNPFLLKEYRNMWPIEYGFSIGRSALYNVGNRYYYLTKEWLKQLSY